MRYTVHLFHYGPQVMKFEPAPVIRPKFFGPFRDRFNGVPLYRVRTL